MKKKEPLYKIIQNPDHEKLLEDQPSIVYKYFDWRNTHNQRVLTHNELFFSSPNNFNDPFDCKIETRFDLMDEKEKYEYFTRVSTNYSKHYNLGWNKDMIEKEVSRLIKEHDFSNTEKVWADNEFLFKQTSNFYGVFCTSTLWDSIPMWGYYANCHKGFCVVFGVRELFYSGRIGKGGMVTYDNYPEIKPNMSAIEKASKETYHKSKDWSHEKEYRLMQLRMPKHKINTITGENGEFIGIKTIAHKNWFKEILIGVNTSEEDTAQIISSCRNKRNDRPTFLFIFGKYLFVF